MGFRNVRIHCSAKFQTKWLLLFFFSFFFMGFRFQFHDARHHKKLLFAKESIDFDYFIKWKMTSKLMPMLQRNTSINWNGRLPFDWLSACQGDAEAKKEIIMNTQNRINKWTRQHIHIFYGMFCVTQSMKNAGEKMMTANRWIVKYTKPTTQILPPKTVEPLSKYKKSILRMSIKIKK